MPTSTTLVNIGEKMLVIACATCLGGTPSSSNFVTPLIALVMNSTTVILQRQRSINEMHRVLMVPPIRYTTLVSSAHRATS